jgi:phospholipid-transporting ATPase
MMNGVKAKPKRSKLEEQLNLYIFFVFFIVVFFCAVGSLLNTLWLKTYIETAGYMFILEKSYLMSFLLRLGNWILIFGNMVPISLMVSLETVKFIQAIIISKDKKLLTVKDKIMCEVQSSNLNEELGQVEYIFSDKTGTLTCNEMVFRKLVIGSKPYGKNISKVISTGEDINKQSTFKKKDKPTTKSTNSLINQEINLMQNSIIKYNLKEVENVIFYDEDFLNQIQQSPEKVEYLEFLALCHTIIIDQGKYNAASPDELALVNFAKMCGIEYCGINDNNEIEIDFFGEIKKYELLDVLEFNSKRKRMSVVIKNEQGKIFMLTKGADNKIIERSKITQMGNVFDELMKNLNLFAIEGLRTLLLAKKEMSEEEYLAYKDQMNNARSLLDGREKAVEDVEELYEQELSIIGMTAIEDRLQDEIEHTILVNIIS